MNGLRHGEIWELVLGSRNVGFEMLEEVGRRKSGGVVVLVRVVCMNLLYPNLSVPRVC